MQSTTTFTGSPQDPLTKKYLEDSIAAADAQSMVTSFLCNGVLTSVTTDRKPQESDEDFAQRHKDEVDDAQSNCT